MTLSVFQKSSDNVLGGHRDRIMQPVAYVVSAFVTPFAINDVIQGRVVLGLVISAVVAIFLINGIAARLKKRPPIPHAVLLVPIVASLLLSIAQQGALGMLWCYPALLFGFFVLPRLMAVGAGTLLVIVATPFVYR
ncbi:MAG: hypothetical protein ACXWNB_09125, partial [Candidatus Binataceae bacterium]